MTLFSLFFFFNKTNVLVFVFFYKKKKCDGLLHIHSLSEHFFIKPWAGKYVGLVYDSVW